MAFALTFSTTMKKPKIQRSCEGCKKIFLSRLSRLCTSCVKKAVDKKHARDPEFRLGRRMAWPTEYFKVELKRDSTLKELKDERKNFDYY